MDSSTVKRRFFVYQKENATPEDVKHSEEKEGKKGEKKKREEMKEEGKGKIVEYRLL